MEVTAESLHMWSQSQACGKVLPHVQLKSYSHKLGWSLSGNIHLAVISLVGLLAGGGLIY